MFGVVPWYLKGHEPRRIRVLFQVWRGLLCLECSTVVPGLSKAKEFLQDLGGQVQNLREDVKVIKEKVGTLEENTDFKNSHEFKDPVSEQLEEFRAEEEEKEYRKPNSIIKGVHEPQGDTDEVKYENDKATIQGLLKDTGIMEEVQIKAITRLRRSRGPQGNEGENSQGPRILKAVLEDEKHKWKIFKNRNKLKEHSKRELQTIQIMSDRTFNERKKRVELAKERDYKNTNERIPGKKKYIYI